MQARQQLATKDGPKILEGALKARLQSVTVKRRPALSVALESFLERAPDCPLPLPDSDSRDTLLVKVGDRPTDSTRTWLKRLRQALRRHSTADEGPFAARRLAEIAVAQLMAPAIPAIDCGTHGQCRQQLKENV